MEAFVPVLAVALAALIGLGILAGVAAERRRRSELAALAAERGWQLVERRERRFEDRFPEFDCLREGDDRRSERTLEGAHAGRPFVGFDYHYTTTSGTGKQQTTTHHRFSGVVVQTELALEPMKLRAEHLFDRVGDLFGFGDVDLEWSAFNDAFHVQAKDRRFAVDVLQQPTMQLLMASPRFQLATGGSRVLAWRSTRFAAADFVAALELVHGVLERLPPSFVAERSSA